MQVHFYIMCRVPFWTILCVVGILWLPHSAAQQPTLKIGHIAAYTYNTTESQLINYLFISGANASFAAANLKGGIRGRKIEFVTVESPSPDPASYPTTLRSFLNQNPDLLALIMTAGDRENIALVPTLESLDLVTIGAFAGSDQPRKQFTKALTFARTETRAELLALIKYFVNVRNVRRIALMYTANMQYGDEKVAEARTMLASMGLELAGVFAYDSDFDTNPASTFNFDLEFLKFFACNPQAVLIFGYPHMATAKFMASVAFYRASVMMGITSTLVTFPTTIFDAVLQRPNGRLVAALNTPLPSDDRYTAVRHFHDDLSIYYGFPYTFTNNDFLMIAGWMSAELALQVLDATSTYTRQGVVNATFSSKLFAVDDLAFGIFADNCTGQRLAHKQMCRCNQGGHVIELALFQNNKTYTPIDNGYFEFPLSDCTSASITLQSPLVLLLASQQNGSSFTALFSAGSQAADATADATPSSRTGALRTVLYTNNSAPEVATTLDDYIVTALFGAVVSPNFNSSFTNVPILGPYWPVATPMPSTYMRHWLYTHATLEQQWHALADASSAYRWDVSIVLRGVDEGIASIGVRSLNTFGLSPVLVRTTADSSRSLSELLRGTTCAFVAGVVPADVTDLVSYLNSNPTASVLMAFEEFAAIFDDLVTATAPILSVRKRVFFATSLSNWLTSNGTLATAYRSVVRSPHPLSFLGFLNARAARTISDRVPVKLTSSDFLNTWYEVSVINLDSENVLGPYSDAPCHSTTQLCEANVGARTVRVFSVDQVVDVSASTAALHLTVLTSNRISYQPLPKDSSLSGGAIAGVVIGCTVGVLALALILVYMAFQRGGHKDNRNAPKDAKTPCTIVFTDIQASTALWAALPQVMSKALDVHHALIRRLIPKYKGYEVKTIGDAFMIAFCKASDALDFAYDLQHQLLLCDWPPEIDAQYRKMLNEGNASSVMQFHGLRVRVVAHSGLAEIRFDEQTQGYDYYGTVVNLASRVEKVTHGGQVVVTRDTINGIPKEEAKRFDLVERGEHNLREFVCVSLVELQTIPQRNFPKLRDVDESHIEDEELIVEDVVAKSPSEASKGELNDAATPLVSGEDVSWPNVTPLILTTFLAPLSERSRNAHLRELCDLWHVHGGHGRESAALISLLSRRVAAVVRARIGTGQQHSSIRNSRHDSVTTVQPVLLPVVPAPSVAAV